MITQTTLQTTEAARISKRLINHWKHKFTIHEHENTYIIDMPDAEVVLTYHPDSLEIQLCGKNDDFNQEKMQEVVANHLDRMAGETFTYQWSF
jgi:hypothetical protein